ncbi:MAG: uroporphyrinogen decarboxylase [Calditrichia bacterium]
MSQILKNDLFIKACFRQPVERTPVWMMRQAGRYLPEYRAVRKNHDFITMYKTPELAAEVTLQPVDLVGVDAAILFSDILVIPEAMGMELQFLEKRGPVFPNPIRSDADLAALKTADVADRLTFVADAIRLCRQQLAGRVPLIGFSGAPWTLATYMIEGSGSKNFSEIKKWRFANPEGLHRLLEQISRAVIEYLKMQMDAGAQALQLFDTWAGILDKDGFREFVLPYVKQILSAVRREGIPLIYFAKGAGVWLADLKNCGADVLGLDWTVDIGEARRLLGDVHALQGNLDPNALFAPPEVIRAEVKKILEKFGPGEGHVFNLGHGILPTVPPEHARAFIQAVKEESVVYHQ